MSGVPRKGRSPAGGWRRIAFVVNLRSALRAQVCLIASLNPERPAGAGLSSLCELARVAQPFSTNGGERMRSSIFVTGLVACVVIGNSLPAMSLAPGSTVNPALTPNVSTVIKIQSHFGKSWLPSLGALLQFLPPLCSVVPLSARACLASRLQDEMRRDRFETRNKAPLRSDPSASV